MGLLAVIPFANMGPDRLQSVNEQFEAAFRDLYGFPHQPHLVTIVCAGLVMFKTPNCGQPDDYNVNCPTCQSDLAAIAAHLPFAHYDSSILVCRITGKTMDEDNPPMVLPNGNVYSLLVSY